MKLSREAVLDVLKRRIENGEPTTIPAIAEEVGCCERTVVNALHDLRKAGRIQKIGRINIPARIEITDANH